jgi:hypothetical protein
MRKQEQHKRFTISMRNDQLSLCLCYWYAPTGRSIMPVGDENDSKYMRSGCVHE